MLARASTSSSSSEPAVQPSSRRSARRGPARGAPPALATPPTLYVAGGSPERTAVIEAIRLINTAINPPDERMMAGLDADPEGYNALLRARGELVRALMPIERRDAEVREAQRELTTFGPDNSHETSQGRLVRAERARVLELHWALRYDDCQPGGFFVAGAADEPQFMVLDRIGTDPRVTEVLK